MKQSIKVMMSAATVMLAVTGIMPLMVRRTRSQSNSCQRGLLKPLGIGKQTVIRVVTMTRAISRGICCVLNERTAVRSTGNLLISNKLVKTSITPK